MDVEELNDSEILQTVPTAKATYIDCQLTSGSSEINGSSVESASINSTSIKNTKENCHKSHPISDDSFEVFRPLKILNKKSCSNLLHKPSGKQKQRKALNRSRTCPYFSTKGVKNYFKSPAISQEDRDLELALALSLQEVSSQNEVHGTKCTDIQEKAASKDNLLILKNWTGKGPKKSSKSLLSRRTSDERNRIITQKLGIILLETQEAKSEENSKKLIEFNSCVSEGLLNKESFLWELSKLPKDIELNSFYVDSLRPFFALPYQSPTHEMEPSDEIFELI